jgi:hypothetical protein
MALSTRPERDFAMLRSFPADGVFARSKTLAGGKA